MVNGIKFEAIILLYMNDYGRILKVYMMMVDGRLYNITL